MVWVKKDSNRYREPEQKRIKHKTHDKQSKKRKKKNGIVRRDSAIDRSRQDSCEAIENSWFGVIDDLLLCGLFGGSSAWGQEMPKEQQVVVRVEATTVLPKRELVECREPEMDIENRLYESNFVGTVTNIDSKASQSNLVRGDQVTSIRKCGTQARFVTMPAESLVVLPENLDMGEALSVISIFLPAFGALHHGRRECRFLPDSLYNKKVLVTGGTLLEAQAVVKLAIWGGASAVYMLSSSTRVPIKVKGNRVTVLPDDKEIWLPLVQQKMDVVVDYDFPNHFGSVAKALGLNGRLVCQSKSRSKGQSQDWLAELEQGFVSEYDSALEMAALCILSNSFLFNFEGICDNKTGELEEDLSFLFRLLAKRQLRPTIDKFIKKDDVSAVQEEMESRRTRGTVICEPWRE